MTVSSTTDRATFPGNGVAQIFPLPFRFFANSDIQVWLVTNATGVLTPQTIGVHYTLTGANDPEVDGSPTSSLTMLTAPTALESLFVQRVIPVTQPTDIINQGRFFPETHEAVFDRLTMLLQQANGESKGAIRVAIGDPEPARLAPAVSRANQLMAFDSLGNPVAAIPASGSATDLALNLLNAIDPAKGASMVGWRGTTVSDALDQIRYIETFGPTDTPENTKTTMQAAIDWCAANNVQLRAKASEYTLDLSASSIAIPDNFRCDLGNAWIKRATGNSTPHDMWINADTVNGNTGLDIRNVRFDGQRQADSLTNANATHRFCGLRLVKCSGYLESVRADNTVNGEIQVEGTRGGIMLDQSVDMRAFKLYADGTDGSGVFPYQGKNYILGVWTKDNTGSGFTSYGCDGNEFHHIYSDGSGYSGVSVNGVGMRCSYLYATNSAVGFAGVNIGHDSAGTRADLSQIDNVVAEDNDGWGITVIGSSNVTGSNWRASANAVRNLFVQNSPSLRVSQVLTRGAVAEDVRIEGTGDHWLDGDFRGGALNGIGLITSGAVLYLGENTILAQYGSGGGTTGALNASAGTQIVCRGQIVSNTRYGAIANGAAALVDLRGAYLDNNTVADTLSVAGGAFRYELTRFSNDPMSGTFTILSGTATVVVANGNSVDAGRIVIMPTDSVSAGAGVPRVSALSAGVSFTATITSNAPSNATYRYVLL